MKELRKKIRALNVEYEDEIERLSIAYKKELKILQEQCPHPTLTSWSYELDTEGELCTNGEGILYKYRECLNCGLVEQRLDDTNKYESEVKF